MCQRFDKNIIVIMNYKINDSLKESSLALSNPFNESSEQFIDNEILLNQMYQRIRGKQRDQIGEVNSQSELSGPLLSYITQKDPQNTSQTLKEKNNHEEQEISKNARQSFYIKNPKRMSINERFKTEINDYSNREQIQQLILQNDTLKNKLNKQEKRISYLQYFEGQVQYLKKICFLQSSQIEKLRKMLRNNRLSDYDEKENRNQQWQNQQLKKTRANKNIIMVQDNQSKITQGNKKKCPHKKKSNYIKNGMRTQSTLYDDHVCRKKSMAKSLAIENQMKKTIPHHKRKGNKQLYITNQNRQ